MGSFILLLGFHVYCDAALLGQPASEAPKLLCVSNTGKQAAFLHADIGDVTNKVASLYVMHADGSNLKEILKREVPLEGGRPTWKAK